MSFIRNNILTASCLAVAMFSLNCGGSSSVISGSSSTVSGTTGILKAADGSPMAGATVAVSTSGAANSLTKALSNSYGHKVRLPNLTDSDGETCEDLSGVTGTIYAQDCTSADGAYSLTGEIPCGETITFTAVKGSFSLSVSVTLTCPTDVDGDGDTTDETVAIDDAVDFGTDCGAAASLSLTKGNPAFTVDAESCEYDIASMAVIQGSFDRIEDVLAKLGYGTVDLYGQLDESQPYDFDLIAEADASGLLTDLDTMNTYDIIFINCSYRDTLAQDSSILTNLQEYVENGGKLYVTDLSYDLVEQAFPGFMDFYGGTGAEDASTPETLSDAWVGDSDITSDATVLDETMATWLDNVYVNDGDIETDCYNITEAEANARLGARNDDGTVTIGDFLPGWAVMLDDHTDATTASEFWIEGPITYNSGTSMDPAPLTVTQTVGEGRILYSSYHTADVCPTLGFWPQERILQYLVFEL